VPCQTNAQKKIATFAATRASFALPSQTDALAFVNAPRNLYLVGFHLFGATAAERNLASGPVQRFFQRDHEIGFDVEPPF